MFVDYTFIMGHLNYWLFIMLMMTGLFIVISRGNLIKKIVGLNIFQTSVFMFYISIGKLANPFATPLEILSEWYFFPTFQLLRTVPNKLLGVLLMRAVPAGLLTVPFIENVNKFQNPFRRPIAIAFFILGTIAAIWFGIGATLPINISLTLGLFNLVI